MSADQIQLPATATQRVRRLAERIHPYHLRYEGQRDARAVFAYVYYNITLDLAERLQRPENGFDDPEWVADLAVAFGKQYLAAMEALDAWVAARGPDDPGDDDAIYDSVPRPWADVYRAACRSRSYVLEDLVFSMGAHISYDLPHALLDVAHEGDHLADYHRMNQVLADRTDFIQEAVGSRYQLGLRKLDWLAGSFDEFYSNYGIRMARAVAWYNAMRLLAPSSAEAAEASIARSTRLFIDSVRNPSEWWARLGVRLVRLLIPRRRRWPPPEPHGPERAGAPSRW